MKNNLTILRSFVTIKTEDNRSSAIFWQVSDISPVWLTPKTQYLSRTSGRTVGRQPKNLRSVPNLGSVCRWATKKSTAKEEAQHCGVALFL